MSELKGKRALVTGGSRGIGASIAVLLAEKGADVAVTYHHSPDRAAEVVRAIEAKGRRGVAIQADSADPAAVRRSVDGAVEALGGLDILINNVGIARVGRFVDLSLADIDGHHAVTAFLASPAASYRTGSVVTVDGGSNA